MSVIGIIFYAFLAIIAISSAIAMLVNRNAIYSALFLVLNFATIAVLYLALGAPFIAFTQITVYAGAIMVLFLFVIALLGAEKALRAGAFEKSQTNGCCLSASFFCRNSFIRCVSQSKYQSNDHSDSGFCQP